MNQLKTAIKIISTLLIFLSFSSCKERADSNTENNNPVTIDSSFSSNIEEIYSFLAVTPTTYSIDPEKDTLITCSQGARLFFSKNSFSFANLDEPSSTIEITVKECYDYADFIGENLSTTSNGDLLETGGMLEITATSEGKEVQLKADKNYTVYFPRNENLLKMDLFYGERDSSENINWTLNTDSDQSNQTSLTLPGSILPRTPICSLRISSHTSKVGDFPVEWKFKNEPGNVFEYFNSNFSLPEDLAKELGETDVIADYSFEIDKNGNIVKIYTSQISDERIDKLLKAFINELPPFDMNTMGDPDFETTMGLGFSSIIKYDYSSYAKNFEENRDNDDILSNVNQTDVDFYVFSATKLGWINCDRFWNSREPKIDFFVQKNADTPMSTYLIFENIRSIMRGSAVQDKFIFSSIPAKKDIKIIGIKHIDGQPQLCVQAANTSAPTLTLEQFESFTLSELKAEINHIN